MKQDYWEAMYASATGAEVGAVAAAPSSATPPPAINNGYASIRQRRRNRMMDQLDDSSSSYEALPATGNAVPMVSMTSAPEDIPSAAGPSVSGGTNRFGTQRRQRVAVPSAPSPEPTTDSSSTTDSYEEVANDDDVYDESTDSEEEK